MSASDERERLFRAVDQELKRYHEALDRGERPPAPEWDLDLFRAFRDWQAARMHRRAREMGVPVVDLPLLPDVPPSGRSGDK